MRYALVVRSVALTAYGAALFYAAVVVLGGVLAAVAIPKAYFEWFSRSHISTALALMFTVTGCLPIAIVVAAGVFVALRTLGSGARSSAAFVFIGMALSLAFGLLSSAASFAEGADPKTSLVEGLKVVLAVPWFAIPNLLGPWLGFAAGVWLSSRGDRFAARADA